MSKIASGSASGSSSSTGGGVTKVTTIETTTPLAANGIFTGPWHDTNLNGAIYVQVTTFSNVASAANGLTIQESDDITNASFTRLAGGVLNTAPTGTANVIATANTLSRIAAGIRARFWRVVYTNGVTLQTTFEITATASSITPMETVNASSGQDLTTTAMIVGVSNGAVGDNISFPISVDLPTMQGNSGPLHTSGMLFGGAFSGTANAALQNWSKPRTPTVFKNVSTAAAGSTALWTPGVNNKFRLLRYIIEIPANAAAAAAGVLVVKLLDGAVDIAMNHSAFVPAAAGTIFEIDDFFSIDLGSFGVLSAAANNVLNVNLSFALTAGVVNVIAMGTEE